MSLGNRIKKVRLNAQKKQDEFAKSIGIKRAWLSSIVLKDWEIIDISPAAGLKDMPEVETNKFIPYTDEEKKIIREYLFLNHYRFFTYLMLIYHCGVRPKEILCLQIKDIDLHTQTITINPSIETENSKTKKIRVVPINDFLMPYLREMRLQDYPKSFFVFGSPFPQGDGNRGSSKEGRGVGHPDYFKPSATQIKRDSVTKFWKKVVIDKLGINKYMYAMKHTGANEKILAGIDLDALRELYGHSSKLMTEKYAKVIKEVYRKQIMEKSPEF
jgi:integrase